jgi:orotidine-5'-phosphate decarboxylase
MNPLIVALDFQCAEDARELVTRLGGRISFYKVGLELFTSAGPGFVRELVGEGNDVFLDLKLYDIGETVKRTVARIGSLGARLATIHGTARSMMRAAVEGRGESGLKLLAVTVLTSFDQSDIADLGYSCTVEELVSLRVRMAMEAGIDGIVCSPLEVAAVRALAGADAVLVTPGVRSAGASQGDQKRVATPAEALRNGANYLVIGRQITRAADPAAEAERLLDEIAAAP